MVLCVKCSLFPERMDTSWPVAIVAAGSVYLSPTYSTEVNRHSVGFLLLVVFFVTSNQSIGVRIDDRFDHLPGGRI
jgi:hypothetical protein